MFAWLNLLTRLQQLNEYLVPLHEWLPSSSQAGNFEYFKPVELIKG